MKTFDEFIQRLPEIGKRSLPYLIGITVAVLILHVYTGIDFFFFWFMAISICLLVVSMLMLKGLAFVIVPAIMAGIIALAIPKTFAEYQKGFAVKDSYKSSQVADDNAKLADVDTSLMVNSQKAAYCRKMANKIDAVQDSAKHYYWLNLAKKYLAAYELDKAMMLSSNSAAVPAEINSSNDSPSSEETDTKNLGFAGGVLGPGTYTFYLSKASQYNKATGWINVDNTKYASHIDAEFNDYTRDYNDGEPVICKPGETTTVQTYKDSHHFRIISNSDSVQKFTLTVYQ